MIRRTLSDKFIKILNNKQEFNNVLLIDGARQVGKTTVVREVLTEAGLSYREFNLEERGELAEKIDHCANFEEFTELVTTEMRFAIGGNELLFIDEAQESRLLGGFVRFMKEKWQNTQVILSGSIMSRMFRDDVRFPVGRVTPLHLHPFSFSEFLTARDEPFAHTLRTSRQNISPNTHHRLLEYVEQYLDVGGLPEVVTTFVGGGDWRALRRDLLFGYYNDFKRVFGEDKQAYFIASMRATAQLLGQPFKNSHVAQLMDGAKNKEVIESLSQLDAWNMLFRIEQRGMAPESGFHPKRYLFDIGIARQLREAAMPSARLVAATNDLQRTSLGGLIENVALLNIIEDAPELSGWKKAASGSEVDFVVKHEDSVLPIECKAAITVKNSHMGGVRDFMRIYNLPFAIVVGLAPFEVRVLPEGKKVLILPLYLIEYWREIIDELKVSLSRGV